MIVVTSNWESKLKVKRSKMKVTDTVCELPTIAREVDVAKGR